MKRLQWFAELAAAVLVTLPIAALPLRAALWLGELLGSLLYIFWKSRREIALDNLREAMSRNAVSIGSSTPEEIIKRNFRNLGRSFAEVVKIYYGLGSRIIRGIEIRGIENITRALERGKGVIIITGHCGNWELLCLPLVGNLPRINAVMRRINNPFFNRIVVKVRERSGQAMVYKEGAIRKFFSVLKRNEIVGILMDQSVVGAEGIKADFLGRQDYILKVPALIARKTGAAVVPAFIRRTGSGHSIDIGDAMEPDGSTDEAEAVTRDTLKFSGCIEEYIRQNPTEWLWLHRRWKREKL